MGKYRTRFNENARSGMLAKQDKLKKARQKQFTRHLDDGTNAPDVQEETEDDTNAELLKPVSTEEREERKRKLTEQLKPQSESKVSRQKRKRLDKYIDHQLKREEKQVLIEKLQDSKFDTSLLESSKLLGRGKRTKQEHFAEAFSLEKQGRGDEKTKEILYEERTVRDWDEDMASDNAKGDEDLSGDDDGDDFEARFGESEPSGFVDMRPKAGGMGSGFTFKNAEKVVKTDKKKYTWRAKVEAQEKKKSKDKWRTDVEDERDFESSEEETSEKNEKEEEEEEEEDDIVEDQEYDEAIDVDEVADHSGSEEASSEEEEEVEEAPASSRKKFSHSSRAADFKEWADEQVRKLEGRLPASASLPDHDYKNYEKIDRPEDLDDGLVDPSVPMDETLARKTHFVSVQRSADIQEARMGLPVYAEEHRIMEAIHHNDIVIICGETGSGKTTQVPQFLYESGYGSLESPENPAMIGITQPRRVAAVSMAGRVANELGSHGDKVGYQIRFDSTTKPTTRMKFMTDGVLLREMMTDFLLEKYSSIIIDEAHERNVNTDILIGMLSRVVRLRHKLNTDDPLKYKKLKLIIMSATLRVSDFSENKSLFEIPPPILEVQARQYSVSVHFNKRTPHDYIEEAFNKTCKIHQRLPPGAILIFMTGQNEITGLVKRLRERFPGKSRAKKYDEFTPVRVTGKHEDVEAEDVELSVKLDDDGEIIDDGEIEDEEEEEGFEETLEPGQTDEDPLYVLPLYSLLPTKEQMKVFESPPPGSRLCVVATNVAETSLTIPGVRYVVDCGRAKERKYQQDTGVQSFEVDWVSKASASQRSGRAGRTGPGHCYRLYSSAVYERDFELFSKPEILRMPIESVVLTMKSMGINGVIKFPFPTPPQRVQLYQAERLLKFLGALDQEANITELGKNMSNFPMSPRFAKMLMLGNQRGCMPYVVAIVSALSVGDPFLNENELGINQPEDQDGGEVDPQELEFKRKLKSKFFSSRQVFEKLDKYSDALRLLSAVCAFDWMKPGKQEAFLRDHFLRPKVMEETRKLRKQVSYIVKSLTSKETIAANITDAELKVDMPKADQIKLLKQVITAGFIDQVAIRADLIDSEVKITSSTDIINIPYIPVLSVNDSESQSPYVYVHSGSVICSAGEIPPSYIVYDAITSRSNPEAAVQPKRRMRSLCNITPLALANVGKHSGLITYSKPLGPPYAPKLVSSTKRECYVVPRYGANIGTGGVGWDLKPVKVIQNRVQGHWVNE